MKYFLCISFLGFISVLLGQDTEIEINNPSFEDRPHRGVNTPGFETQIKGWYDCGQLQFRNETPPDVHPIGAWKVTQGPSDGNTYLGMVIRDNDSWESVAQRLSIPIEEGKCYAFNVDLSRSNYYISGSRKTNSLENYTKPAVLRIWGGTGVCGKQELLGESTTVSHDEWRTYEFKFEPQRSVNYFTLEAFYKTPTLIPYNGHVLVDNASLIKEVPCDAEQILSIESTTEETSIPNPKPAAIAVAPPVTKKTAPVPVAEMLVEEVDVATVIPVESNEEEHVHEKNDGLYQSKYKAGEIIRMHNIYFAMDDTAIKEESHYAIDELFEFMKRNKGIVIEIGGHTNTVPPSSYCDELSSIRAKEVAKVLAAKGVSTNRMYFKGYGKRKPIDINDRHDKEARRKNQRVEIKILQTDFSGAGD